VSQYKPAAPLTPAQSLSDKQAEQTLLELHIGVALVALQPTTLAVVFVHSTHAPVFEIQYASVMLLTVKPAQVLLEPTIEQPTQTLFKHIGVLPEQSVDDTAHSTHAPVGTHFKEFGHVFLVEEQAEQTPSRVQMGRVDSLQSVFDLHATHAPDKPQYGVLPVH
jgi:hypothetical protein